MILRLRHWAGDPLIEVMLSLLTPFIAFWVPHSLGGSGVLATVVAGLYVGYKGVDLIRSNTRLQALFFWEFLVYLLEGAIFLLTGLQAKRVMEGLEAVPWSELLFYALCDQCRRDPGAVHLGVSSDLSAENDLEASARSRPRAALAASVRDLVYGGTRSRVARCGAQHSVRTGIRSAVSGSQPYSVSHIQRHRGDVGAARDRHCPGWYGGSV